MTDENPSSRHINLISNDSFQNNLNPNPVLLFSDCLVSITHRLQSCYKINPHNSPSFDILIVRPTVQVIRLLFRWFSPSSYFRLSCEHYSSSSSVLQDKPTQLSFLWYPNSVAHSTNYKAPLQVIFSIFLSLPFKSKHSPQHPALR
jgi:hypothetical protein